MLMFVLFHGTLTYSTVRVALFRLMVTVTHSVPSSLGSSGRNVRFLQAAFNKSGDCFIAGDHYGNIFVFDLVKNRLVVRTCVSGWSL